MAELSEAIAEYVTEHPDSEVGTSKVVKRTLPDQRILSVQYDADKESDKYRMLSLEITIEPSLQGQIGYKTLEVNNPLRGVCDSLIILEGRQGTNGIGDLVIEEVLDYMALMENSPIGRLTAPAQQKYVAIKSDVLTALKGG